MARLNKSKATLLLGCEQAFVDRIQVAKAQMQCRFGRWLLILGLFSLNVVSGLAPVCAHEGVDHGDAGHEVAPPAAVPADESRVDANSEEIELVGIAKGGKLWLYVDRYSSNEPLEGVSIEVSEGANKWAAKPEGRGIYSVSGDWLKQAGDHHLMFALTSAEVNDLLIGTLQIKAQPHEASHLWEYAKWIGFGALLLGGLWLASRTVRRNRSRAAAAMSLVLLALLVAQPFPLWAQDGAALRAGPTSNPGKLGNRPFKQADGRVFMPKPAQNTLGIRTAVVSVATVGREVALAGQVIADPNHSGGVQSAQAGTIEAPPAGLPNLGQRVRKGQTLAYLRPSLTSMERANQEAQLEVLKKDLYLTTKQLERVTEQLTTMHSVGTNVSVDVARTEVKTLKLRIADVEKGLFGRVELRAPIAGVISRSNTFIGQAVAPGQSLFEIVDPARVWVEALSYDSNLAQQVTAARAITTDRKEMDLAYKGQGYQLRNQAIPLQFALKAEGLAAAIGQPVTVLVRTSERLTGMAVPADSVTGGSQAEIQDQAVVWLHDAAEWFTPKRVKLQMLDSKTAVVLEGLSAGDRVVTEGASYLAQIR